MKRERLDQLRQLWRDALERGDQETRALCLHDLALEFPHQKLTPDMPPAFETLGPKLPPIPPGTYVAKITAAKEKVSDAGNTIISMKLALPSRQTIHSVLTFFPAARPVINAFAASCELLVPTEANVSVELPVNILSGRYCYIVISYDPDELTPRVSRFLTRAEALIANPEIAKITLQPQPPIQLVPVTNKADLFSS